MASILISAKVDAQDGDKVPGGGREIHLLSQVRTKPDTPRVLLLAAIDLLIKDLGSVSSTIRAGASPEPLQIGRDS